MQNIMYERQQIKNNAQTCAGWWGHAKRIEYFKLKKQRYPKIKQKRPTIILNLKWFLKTAQCCLSHRHFNLLERKLICVEKLGELFKISRDVEAIFQN